MKKGILLLAVIVGMLPATAQKKKGNTVADPEYAMYAQAMKYGDVPVAVNCLYSLMGKYPDRIALKDSLARIYFQTGQYFQCLQVCNDLQAARPNDTTTLRMMAICYEGSGKITEAIGAYEQVLKLSYSAYDMYQKATLEYRIKRMAESKLSVESVISKAHEGDEIVLYIDQENKQKVPLRAAAFNLYGMIAKDMNDTASARILFQKALEMYPQFYFAQANIQYLNEMGKKKAEPAETPSGTPAVNDPKKK